MSYLGSYGDMYQPQAESYPGFWSTLSWRLTAPWRSDVATWRRGDLSAIRSLLKSSILALAVPWNWLCLHGGSLATYHLVDSWSLICTFITQPPLPVPTCVWLYYWVWFMVYPVSFLNLILTELPCIFYQLSSFFSSDPLYQVNV